VPVEELQDRVEQHRARAQAIVGRVVLQARVLRVVAQLLDEAAVERGERDEQGEDPVARVNRRGDDSGVAEQAEARPGEQAAAGGGPVGREEVIHPLAVDDAEAEADLAAEVVVDPLDVDDAVLEEAEGGQLDREGDLEVVRRVQRVFMVFLVAGPERDRVVAGNKADEVEEERVQPAGAEDRAVAELVEAVQKEGVDAAVEEKGGQEQGDRADRPGVEGGGAGEGDDGEVAARLSEAEQVAALIEASEQVAVDRGAVPVDALGDV